MNSIPRVGIEGEAVGQRPAQQHGFQPHRLGPEQARVHGPGIADDRAELHQRQDVPLDVDARRHLGQLQSLRRQAEDAALGDVEHGLAGRGSAAAVEGDLLDRTR